MSKQTIRLGHRHASALYWRGQHHPGRFGKIPTVSVKYNTGAEIGADAVIVRNDQRLNDRHVVVEGEAIRFTSKAQ